MALLDIAFYPKDFVLYEARGNIGTLLDIVAMGPAPGLRGSKINEEARGNTGVLVDIGATLKIQERPGYTPGETSHTFLA